jgi:hypothetical protein
MHTKKDCEDGVEDDPAASDNGALAELVMAVATSEGRGYETQLPEKDSDTLPSASHGCRRAAGDSLVRWKERNEAMVSHCSCEVYQSDVSQN